MLIAALVFSCTDEQPEDTYYAPQLTASGTNNLGRTSATVSGKFDGKLSRVKEYGVKYSTSSLFPEDQTSRVRFEGAPSAGTFSATLTGLNSNTQYYYCLYATTGGTEVTSDLGSFSTVSTSKPAFEGFSLDSIGENVAVIRFCVSEIGDEYLVEQGVSYRKHVTGSTTQETYVPVTTDSLVNASTREYIAVIYNLSAATQYEIRPYAKNSSDPNGDNGMIEGYGDTQTFITEDQKSPVVETYDITQGNVGISSVVLSGIVTSAPGSNGVLDEIGFCYSENREEPTWTDSRIVLDVEPRLNTAYTATLTGLKENTTYYVRMYAKNTVDGSARYGYGETKQFTTSQLATPIFDETLTTATAAAQSITITATIDNYDENALVEKGFYWSTSYEGCTLDAASKLGNSVKVTEDGRTFSTTITGLNVGVVYYIGAYAVYKSDQKERTGYFSEPYQVSTSGFTAASLNTPVVTDETYFGATITGIIRSQGNGEITAKGFVISRDYYEPTIDHCDFHAYGDDNFQYTFTDLTQGTFYYVRAYVTSELAGKSQTIYSDYASFNTTSVTNGALKDITVSDVTYAGAKLASGINSQGDGELTEVGFCWAPSAELSENLILDKATGSVKVDLTAGSDEFTASITNLNYSTEYKVRAYMKTLVDEKLEVVTYSSTEYFTTNEPKASSLKSLTISNVSLYSMDVSAEMSSAGDGTVIEKGFLWSPLASMDYWTSLTLDNAENHVAISEGTAEAFQTTLTGLTLDTEYRIAAYVTTELNGVQYIGYSESRDISTASAQLPQMNEPTVSNLSYFSASFKMNMYETGNYTILSKGVCISSTTSEPVLNDCEFKQTFEQSDTCTVTGFKQDTYYYARSYAVCSLDGQETTTYSGTRSFRTSAVNAPQFGNLTLENATLTSFDASTLIRDEGNATITERGFCWIPVNNLSSYWDAVTLDNATGSQAIYTDDFKYTVTNLSYDMEYRVAAYVKYSMGDQFNNVAYSDPGAISTTSPELPSLDSPTISDVSYFTAMLTFKMSSEGNYTIVRKGLIISSQTDQPTLDYNEGVCETTAVNVSDLTSGTTYYVRSFAVAQLDNTTETVYSGTSEFTTLSLSESTFSQLTFSNVGLHTLDVSTGIVTQGTGEVQEKGFCWIPTESMNFWDALTLETTNVQHVAVSDGTTASFNATLSGLTANTNYRVVAYAKAVLGSETKISYSDAREVNTAAAQLPQMNAPTVNEVNFFDATLKLNMYDEGNYIITRKGVCLSSKRDDPVIADCEFIQDFGTDNTCKITGLAPNTNYWARSFVVCHLEGEEEETTYSSDRSFMTSEITMPKFKSLEVSNISFTTFDVSCGIREQGDGEIVEKGFCWIRTQDYPWDGPTLENAKGSFQVTDGTTESFSCTAQYLEMNTEYRVAAYVKYQVGNYQYSGVAYSDNTTFSTVNPELPSLDIPSVSNVKYNSATFTNRVGNSGNYEITEMGVVLSKTEAEVTIYYNDATGVYGTDGTFTVTGLTPNTSYNYRSYAKCQLNGVEQIVYSSWDGFNTSEVEYPSIKLPKVENVSYSTVDLSFVLQTAGDYTIAESGICVSTKTGEPSVGNYEFMTTFKDGETVYKLTGLKPSTHYYARSYVVCILDGDESTRETRYSGTQEFTTSTIALPTYNSISVSGETWTTMNVTASIGELGDGTLTEHGFIWKKENDGSEVTLDNYEGILKVSGTDKDYSGTITGLLPATWHYVRAYTKTKLQGFEVVGYSDRENRYTSDYSIDNRNTTPTGNTTETVTFTYSNDVVKEIKECGVVYSTEEVEASEMTKKTTATVSATDSKTFTVKLEGLESNKRYYYYVYTKFEGGISYKGRWDFTTKAIPTIDDNVSPSKKD
jgi:hypothetical protein